MRPITLWSLRAAGILAIILAIAIALRYPRAPYPGAWTDTAPAVLMLFAAWALSWRMKHIAYMVTVVALLGGTFWYLSHFR